VIPLSDGIAARRFRFGNVALHGSWDHILGNMLFGTAFFAHVGGFVFGVLVAAAFANTRRRAPIPTTS
jgi:membrane associated rhomboid family serine protease